MQVSQAIIIISKSICITLQTKELTTERDGVEGKSALTALNSL